MRAVVISNDVVPDQGGLVAAPGLRAHGLASGLRAHGIDVSTVVVADAVDRYHRVVGPLSEAPDVEVVAGSKLLRFLKSRRPVVAIMINGNQADHLQATRGVRIVYDGFAPRMLELAYRGGTYPEADLTELARLEGRAMRMADALIVNGARKVPYYLAALLQAGRDLRKIPTGVVEMAVPARVAPHRPVGNPPLVALTGYRQDWNPPGSWVDIATEYLGTHFRALVVEGRHWGAGRAQVESLRWRALLEHPAVEVRPPLPWQEFTSLWSEVDLAVDLFEQTPERRLAMVTRSVVALAHGIPVAHPPFSEVSPLITEAGAGWLVDPGDPDAVAGFFSGLDPDDIAARRRGAQHLAGSRLNPSVAVEPLVEILQEW
jgi:hypothetical protein